MFVAFDDEIWTSKLLPVTASHALSDRTISTPRRPLVTTEDKVIAIVSKQLGVPKEDISRSSSFVDDLKADSLDVVELVMEFEDEFGIQIPDEDYDKIKTVGDAIDYIEDKS